MEMRYVFHIFHNFFQHYEAQYETIEEDEESDFSFIKVFDAGKKVLVHKHEGHIQSRIVYYLMNVHITPRTIYIARHGESYNNVEGRLSGDSDLTPRGEEFAVKLGEFFNNLDELGDKSDFKVWTSWMKRAIDTAQHIDAVQER
jgi:6-phosphofructo-2-kinase/fructose-2,6-biphosphatase 2